MVPILYKVDTIELIESDTIWLNEDGHMYEKGIYIS
jgi:hypothetical protein